VIKEKNGHRHCQKIEERIVACQENEQLKRERGKSAGLAQLPWGEDQKRRHKLDRKRGERRSAQDPRRELVGVPCEDRRQRLGVEVILERRQVSPGGIVASQLDVTRKEIKPERQPAVEPGDGALTGSGASEKDRQKAGFQQKGIPLEREKLLRYGAEGKVKHPAGGERQSFDAAKQSQRAEHHAQEGGAFQYAIRGSPPEHGGQRQVTHRTKIRRNTGEKVPGGLDAMRSHEPENLHSERAEGDDVNRREEAEKNPLGRGEALRLDARSKSEARGPIKQVPVAGNEPVRRFGKEGQHAPRLIPLFAPDSIEQGPARA